MIATCNPKFAAFDKELLNPMEAIEKPDNETKKYLLFSIDNIIQHVNAKKAFLKKYTVMHVITINVINDKVLNLLRDLEALQLIQMTKTENRTEENWVIPFEGTMPKQSLAEIDQQLRELI